MNIKKYKNKTLAILSIPLVLLIMCIGTSIGSSNISLTEIFSIIMNKTFGVPTISGVNAQKIAIIWNLRLPRVILAFIVGGSLAASGAVVQSILKNQLASPYTLGISSGASLGVGIVIAAGISIPFLGNMTLAVVGFICSLITMWMVVEFSAKVDRDMSNSTIILSGMVISLFFNGVLTTITSLISEKMQSITLWSMGSFSMKGWKYVRTGIPFFIIGIIGISLFFKEMDIMTFGEEQAKSIGVDTPKIKKILFVFVAVLTGSAVALSGTIGFVDLIAPHIVRKIFGSKHSYVIPMSVMFGGSMMIVTDLISRTIVVPSELPVGAVTALIGGPFFAYIYFKKSK